MTDRQDGGSAFPQPDKIMAGRTECWRITSSGGMTLRDWFAGQALAGMHARDSYDDGQATPEQRAHLAYLDADAMLKAREQSR